MNQSPFYNLSKLLRTDHNYKQSWLDNIAMSYKDSYHQYKKETGKGRLNNQDLHTVANNAADYFISVLLLGEHQIDKEEVEEIKNSSHLYNRKSELYTFINDFTYSFKLGGDKRLIQCTSDTNKYTIKILARDRKNKLKVETRVHRKNGVVDIHKNMVKFKDDTIKFFLIWAFCRLEFDNNIDTDKKVIEISRYFDIKIRDIYTEVITIISQTDTEENLKRIKQIMIYV